MRQKKEPADKKKFEWELIKEFDRTQSERGGTILCVERWIVDGKKMAPKFGRREIYTTETGERQGKAQFLMLGDLRIIQDRWEEIVEAMTGRAPAAAATPKANTEAVNNGIPDGEPF